MVEMAVEHQAYISAEEFIEIVQRTENVGRHLELVEGVIVEMSGAGGEHGEIVFETGRQVGNFVKERKLGRITAAETAYILYKNPDRKGKDTVRQPDVAFIAADRAPQPLGSKPIPFAPDFAVEVISPGNEADEIHTKVLDYLRYGTRLVWVIYPSSRTVMVYTKTGAKIYEENDTLDGGDVLPGFTLKVRDIFPE